jgi:hypothetical protein
MRVVKKLCLLPVIGAVALLGATSGAKAADPGFCRDYAATAVRQFNAAFSVPRCRGGMNGPRWSPEFHIHYDWCLGAPYNAARAEEQARGNYIYGCR